MVASVFNRSRVDRASRFFRLQFSAGYTINMFGFDFRHGQGKSGRLMIDATHLKAHRTAASLLKKGLFPDVSGAPKAA
jgi:hypothetical protein